MIRSSNPVLSDKAFQGLDSITSDTVMTLDGTINKTAILLALTAAPAVYTYSNPEISVPFLIPIIIATAIIGLILVFKRSWSPFLAPAYALMEGVFLGAISASFNARYPGIVFQAVTLTFLTMACLLFAYRSGWIKVTENFKLGLAAATGAILLFYVVMLLASLFGFTAMSSFYAGSSPLSIGLSVVICGVAALNLVMDFDFIENAAASRSQPKYMEWYGAFGLLVTLVWLYIEILRLLSKLQKR